MRYQAFVIHPADNVGTALEELAPGEISLAGHSKEKTTLAKEIIRQGHKVALSDIVKGAPIVKYGTTIGSASCSISRGDWVHLHNLSSQFDERSGTLDAEDGAPTESGIYV